MASDLSKVPLLARREIEARILAPVIAALAPACGRELVLAKVGEAIEGLAVQMGVEMAARSGQAIGVSDLDTVVELWSYDGSLEVELLAHSSQAYDFNVKRCRYAEMYRELGLEQLGLVMSCQRDFAFFKGFNPRIKLTRTRTIMEGADHCDFRFSWREEGEQA